MSVTRVYVGEPGGENLDVLKENTNEETKGKARFEPGDVVSVPDELAERLDASWAEEGSEGAASESEAESSAEAEGSASEEASPEGGE